jgi:hypothetical protein
MIFLKINTTKNFGEKSSFQHKKAAVRAGAPAARH